MRSGTGLDKANHADPSIEWLETNGLGDYATSTAAGINTRRYHGLLVANVENMDRHVLLSCLEDWLCTPGASWPLSSRHHPFCVFPEGQKYLTRFAASPCPTFVFRAGDYEVTRSIALLHGRSTVLVRYRIRALERARKNEQLVLRVSPLLAFRSHHALTHANMDLHVKTYPSDSGFKIQPYNSLPPLYVQVEGLFDFLPSPEWINKVEYPVEQQRGFDFAEDLFSPGLFEIHAVAGDNIVLAASTAELRLEERSLHALWDAEMAAREAKPALPHTRKLQSSLLPFLAAQSGDFLFARQEKRHLLLAGLPWFGSWGRDTLIALPGTTFLAGRMDEGLEILATMAGNMRNGLIPNTFDGEGQPKGWNSVDASLWFAWDCQLMLKALARDKERQADFLELCSKAVFDIVDAFREGRVPFVRMASTGLLETGTAQTQLTWMDAQVNGSPVTPRNGYPVEIEALWYNTLAFAHSLAKKLGRPTPCSSRELKAMAAQFAAKFVLPDGTLCDVWRAKEDGGPDTALRPNQLIAVSLPEAIAPKENWSSIVAAATQKLLTPYGLRTLSPDHEAFCPTYGGGINERDTAYHQGTVWPWLLGPYTEAMIRACEHEEGQTARNSKSRSSALSKAVKSLLKTITPLVTTHLREAGMGHISEVFSATEPYTPGGSIAQAWSEGEVFRALLLLRDADREIFDAWERSLKLFALKQ